MKKLILFLFALGFMGLSAPAVFSSCSTPALAGKAGGDKYRLPHKLKHDKDNKQTAQTAKLA